VVTEIKLDGHLISVYQYHEEKVNDLHKISVGFKVTSEEYHDTAMLLYRETFDVIVPERKLSFRGRITNYSTSITNLYLKGQVGDYQLTLTEIVR